MAPMTVVRGRMILNEHIFGGAPPGASPLLYHSCEGQPRDSVGSNRGVGSTRYLGRRPARSATPPGVRRRPAGGSSCGHILALEPAHSGRVRRAGGVGGVREGAWVRRAPAGSGSGRHVEEGGCRRLERRGVPLCFAADSPSSEPARGGEPRPVSLVWWRRQLASAGSGCGHHVDEGGLSATRVARGLRCAAQALLPIQRLAFGASRGRRR
mmetsp:Transcript_26583/g.79447  ORF Transcript_26583/g.79447 Transcript_26583/m.79447 type:complete len:211 (-) Transcript_26583:215-847(-)